MNVFRMSRMIAEEPYRLFFPLGVVFGIVGVALWPLWFAGALEVYPGLAHARIMIEGFFAAFILGFLGTAGPRMLGVRALSPWILTVIGLSWLLGQIASLSGAHGLAEMGFAVAAACFLGGFAVRLRQRKRLPPPGFALVILSLLLAVPAAVSQMPVVQQSVSGLPVQVWLLGRAFLVEGFLLLPILGVAPFFFGRFGGLPPRHRPGNLPSGDSSWRRQALICGVAGLAVLVGVGLKAVGHPRWGGVVQAIATGAYIWTQVPFRYASPVGTLARVAQVSLICMVAAPLAEALWPAERLAWRHLLLIPGFQFVVVAVGTWVIFAHAGRGERCLRKWAVLCVMVIAWLIAVISRMVAEFLPAIYENHLIYAAVFWIAASIGWLCLLLPRLREDG